jgi:hypothetical protein
MAIMNTPQRIVSGALASCLVVFSGCNPPLKILQEEQVTVQCDKKFQVRVRAKNPLVPDTSAKSPMAPINTDVKFIFAVINLQNVAPNAAASPPDPLIKAQETLPIDINGELEKPCQGGKLTLSADAEAKPLVAADLPITIPALSIQSAVVNAVNPFPDAEGFFKYTITLTCCPNAGKQNITTGDFKGVKGVRINQLDTDSITCLQSDTVQITGKLDNPEVKGKLDIRITNAAGTTRCVIPTLIPRFEPPS